MSCCWLSFAARELHSCLSVFAMHLMGCKGFPGWPIISPPHPTASATLHMPSPLPSLGPLLQLAAAAAGTCAELHAQGVSSRLGAGSRRPVPTAAGGAGRRPSRHDALCICVAGARLLVCRLLRCPHYQSAATLPQPCIPHLDFTGWRAAGQPAAHRTHASACR